MAYLRSRTGCWTCRFRKKKCDEATPICNSCKTLHIFCESMEKDQPLYMRDAEAANRKKEEIKSQMGKCKRRRKRKSQKPLVEFPVQRSLVQLSAMPTEHLGPSGNLEDNSPMPVSSMTIPRPIFPQEESSSQPIQNLHWRLAEEKIGTVKLPLLTIEKETNRQKISRIEILVHTSDNVPDWAYACTPKSDFSSFKITNNSGANEDFYVEKFLETDFTSTGPSQIAPSDTQLYTSVLCLKNHQELRLIQHYIYDVCRYTYKGMPKDNLDKLMRQALIPRCRASDAFRQGCLSSGVLHLMVASGQDSLNLDAIKYRDQSVTGLQNMLKDPSFHYSEDMLGIILIIATYDINSACTKWDYHVDAAVNCVVNLDVLNQRSLSVGLSFLTRRVVWLDILSSCTTGRKARLWANYRYMLSLPRERINVLKLYEIVGFSDEVLYLLSEVHCLEEYRDLGFEEKCFNWEAGKARAKELDRCLVRAQPEGYRSSNITEHGMFVNTSPQSSFSSEGTLSLSSSPSSSSSSSSSTFSDSTSMTYTALPDYGAISDAITAAFIAAARIHMWSIGIGYYPRLEIFRQFLRELMYAVRDVPDDHIRCILYPLLVGGSLATEQPDREFFIQRFRLPEPCGILGRVHEICTEVWRQRDEFEQLFGIVAAKEVHWRSIIKMKPQKYDILYV
ncbi:fungal-specific transcription factor domain-containing protein [Geopyxis carbonaria]|nr:fungal-specific transcription factor domain-containing protein [Geopyxis carbonaria]